MARHFRRRLIYWFLAGAAALALLVLVALAALWRFLDPDDYRSQIESRAGTAIGRPVHLTGALRWQLGRRIYIVSEGGDIANAAGFGPDPLARWSRIRLGVAARPLLDKRVVIDRIEVDGLQLQLQRDAQGKVNWELQGAGGGGGSGAQSVSLRVGAVALRDSTMQYRDAGTGADWHVTALEASAKLPEDLTKPDREFRDVAASGRVAGGSLAEGGVAFGFQAPALRLSPQQLQISAFNARWADALLGGEVVVRMEEPGGEARLTLKAPSLRALLATVGVTPPPMRDATTLGNLQLEVALRYAAGAAAVEDLSMKLDDTQLTGKVELPKLDPVAIRFALVADRIDLDRYREPSDTDSRPLELPLAWLKSLDARGSLSIRQSTIAGAAASGVRIDVE
jgi:AsmA protein